MSGWQERIESKIKNYLKSAGSCHDYWHAIRVRENALEISKKIECDLDILSAAALLHDVGYLGNEHIDKRHHEFSMNLARRWLAEVNFPKQKIKDVVEAIRLHDNFSWGHNYEKTDHVETLILQDADRIDALGAIGIARLACYYGEKKFPIYSPGKVKKTREVWLNHSLADQLIRDVIHKWENMNFDYSRKISKSKNGLLKLFCKRLRAEILSYHNDWEDKNVGKGKIRYRFIEYGRQLVIGIAGTNCSGKDVVAKIISQKLKMPAVRMSAPIVEIAKKRGLDLSRRNLVKLGLEISQTRGGDFLAKKMLEKDRPMIVVGIRQPTQVEYFRKKCNFVLIGVDAPIESRFERSKKSDYIEANSVKQFRDDEAKENSGKQPQRIFEILEKVDYLVINDGTIEGLEEKVVRVIKKIKKKYYV